MMNQDQFAAKRQNVWHELTSILDQTQKVGPRRMPLEAVQRLGRLYRWAASDLAYARTYFPGSQVSLYLNDLVTRAHSTVYEDERHPWRAVWRFFAIGVPQEIRRAAALVWIATAFIVAGTIIGWLAIYFDPHLTQAIVPEQILSITPQPKTGEIWPAAYRAGVGTQIMINNVLVGVRAFAFGITLGVGTALTLFFNGLMLGALAAKFHQASLSFPFWALILPHGIIELMAIILCGAAGFALGWPIVSPGELTRKEAIAQGARRALVLLVGSVPVFVVAAMIEGWVTPMSSLSETGKYVVGFAMGLLLLAYWLLPGRKAQTTADPGL